MTGKKVAQILAAHKTMQDFLKRQDVQELIESENFEGLYFLAAEEDFVFIGEMHWLFEGADINPLTYMTDYLPSKYCQNDSCLKSFTVPGKFTTLGDQVFAGAEALREVELEEGVKFIGAALFSGCVQLTKVVLPISVKNLPSHTFRLCTRLKEIIYKGDVRTANNDVFSVDRVFAGSAIQTVKCRNGELQIDTQGKIKKVIEY